MFRFRRGAVGRVARSLLGDPDEDLVTMSDGQRGGRDGCLEGRFLGDIFAGGLTVMTDAPAMGIGDNIVERSIHRGIPSWKRLCKTIDAADGDLSNPKIPASRNAQPAATSKVPRDRLRRRKLSLGVFACVASISRQLAQFLDDIFAARLIVRVLAANFVDLSPVVSPKMLVYLLIRHGTLAATFGDGA